MRLEAGQVADESFDIDVLKVGGTKRRQDKRISAVRNLLADDMRLLRAVRGFDPYADTVLAESAFVVLTYDNNIRYGEAPASLSVQETIMSTTELAKVKVMRPTTTSVQDSLNACIDRCGGNYAECQGDPNVGDKTACHTNRTSCENNCYSIYGNRRPSRPPIQP